jgi:hypothetical protein
MAPSRSAMASLRVFACRSCNLTGVLPNWPNVHTLETLQLAGNQLHLTSTSLQWSSFTLTSLDLSHNAMESLPAGVSFVAVNMFNLSYNKLSGSLPGASESPWITVSLAITQLFDGCIAL